MAASRIGGDPNKALGASLKRLAQNEVKKAIAGQGIVESINPDGSRNVDDGAGGCLITLPPGNSKVGDPVSLSDQVSVGQTNTAPPVFSVAPDSTVACPSGELCDLAPGGAAPDAPAGLMLTVASETEIDLSWMADACAASFNIDRASGDCDTNSGFSRIATGVTDVTYADTGLTADTTYAYRVTAVGANGSESEMSDCASATTSAHVGTPTLFATGGDAWDLTTGLASAASHPSALSDAFGYNEIGLNFTFGPSPGYNAIITGDTGGTTGLQGYGASSFPSGTAGGRYQLGKGPSSGIVAGLEFPQPLTFENPNPDGSSNTMVLTLRDATTGALIAQDDLSDVIAYMQAHDSGGAVWDRGGDRAHLAAFVPEAGVVPDPDGSFWIITSSGNLSLYTPPTMRIFKRSGVDGSAVSNVDLDLSTAFHMSWGTDPGQITLV